MSKNPASGRSFTEQEAFDKLLMRLNADRDEAGRRYEEIRRKLIHFFSWEGLVEAEMLADECLTRLVSKLADGIEIMRLDAYLFGIARLVLKEALRERDKRNSAFDGLGRREVHAQPDDEAGERVRRCLDSCLDRLPVETRHLIVEYYRGEKGEKRSNRAALAQQLGISANALRNRALRLRIGLQDCVRRCYAVAKQENETN